MCYMCKYVSVIVNVIVSEPVHKQMEAIVSMEAIASDHLISVIPIFPCVSKSL